MSKLAFLMTLLQIKKNYWGNIVCNLILNVFALIALNFLLPDKAPISYFQRMFHDNCEEGWLFAHFLTDFALTVGTSGNLWFRFLSSLRLIRVYISQWWQFSFPFVGLFVAERCLLSNFFVSAEFVSIRLTRENWTANSSPFAQNILYFAHVVEQWRKNIMFKYF